MGDLSQFHDGIYFKVLLTIVEVFLSHISCYRRKALHEDGYEKVIKLPSFKYNLVATNSEILLLN